jgi:hypothetical protein
VELAIYLERDYVSRASRNWLAEQEKINIFY